MSDLHTISPEQPTTFSPQDCSMRVLKNHKLTDDVCVLVFETPKDYPISLPGQFVNIKVADTYTPLLRRPFSIHNSDDGTLEILLKVIGDGTRYLYEAKPGEHFQVMGPLGNAFQVEGDFTDALLVSGGIGIGPMALLEKALTKSGKTVYNYIGGRTPKDIIKRQLSNIRVSTDNGQEGFKGNVVGLLEQDIAEFDPKSLKVFACGPTPMLKALQTFSQNHGPYCELSLETFMGCGIGICYGCSVRTKNSCGEIHNELLCRCGPVMDSEKVMFED